MTEFANFLTNGMPAGYSSLGGYGFNPYDPRPDPRAALDALMRPFNDGRPALTPGGSSSGPGSPSPQISPPSASAPRRRARS